jgi:hypothetical protein
MNVCTYYSMCAASYVVSAPHTAKSKHMHYTAVKPEDLEVVRTLGAGAFGNVKLVKHKVTATHHEV